MEITGAAKLIEWTGSRFKTESELYDAWIRSPAVQHFERGHCSKKEFSSCIVSEFHLPVSEEAFIKEFIAWPNGLLTGAKSLLQQVKKKFPVACLSNTNEMHWPTQKDADFLHNIFDQMFLSYQLGMVKPDQEIYRHMIHSIGIPAQHILFLDDNQINVDGATQLGLTSCLTKGVEEARFVLEKFGCITDK